jgi:signal transduction histidine kinase
MTSDSSEAAGELGLRIAEIAVAGGSARRRDDAIVHLVRERLAASHVACYERKTSAGKSPTVQTRANDARLSPIHPQLARAARQVASAWLRTGTAGRCALIGPRFGGWEIAGCLPGGASAGLALIALWPPDEDVSAGADLLVALGPVLRLAFERGGNRPRRMANAERRRDESLDDAKAGFVSLVSHALRTPLNTLTGFVEIVLDQPVGPLNERQREFLTYARISGQELTALVEDVTLLSRADEGKLTLRRERLDAGEVAAHAMQVVQVATEAKRVTIRLRVEGEALSLAGDSERLPHALAKLLENAVKFSLDDGAVSVTIGATDGAVEFAVRDQGEGVAPEDAERIFERFYQAEQAARTHPGGYGLGLAVAQVIARGHGGAVWVESEPGHGATFILSVPVSAPAKARQRVATKIRRGASSVASAPS